MRMLTVIAFLTFVSNAFALDKGWTPTKFAAFADDWYFICSMEEGTAALDLSKTKNTAEFLECTKKARDDARVALGRVKATLNAAAVLAAKNYYAAFIAACSELEQMPTMARFLAKARGETTKNKLAELRARFEAEL